MLSIILPAKNEAPALAGLLPELQKQYPEAEIIVSDDGSTDDTSALCEKLKVQRVWTPYSMGNGAAIKRGARAARGDVLLFMDADGQHQPPEIAALLAPLEKGYDMVIGARSRSGQANSARNLANAFYSKLASLMTGHAIPDLTSGFRAVRANRFKEFLHLLPNGFSYPTTSTMAFFRSGHPVMYVPIAVQKRQSHGRSHIRLLRDGLGFLLIIFKIATLYSPLKLFTPVGLTFFLLGWIYYAYTFLTQHHLSLVSAAFWGAGVVVFLIGLVSEQITMLTYQRGGHE